MLRYGLHGNFSIRAPLVGICSHWNTMCGHWSLSAPPISKRRLGSMPMHASDQYIQWQRRNWPCEWSPSQATPLTRTSTMLGRLGQIITKDSNARLGIVRSCSWLWCCPTLQDQVKRLQTLVSKSNHHRKVTTTTDRNVIRARNKLPCTTSNRWSYTYNSNRCYWNVTQWRRAH